MLSFFCLPLKLFLPPCDRVTADINTDISLDDHEKMIMSFSVSRYMFHLMQSPEI